MKIAVFSDVHGNLKSLKAIFEQIKEMKVDQIVFWEIFFSVEMKKLNA